MPGIGDGRRACVAGEGHGEVFREHALDELWGARVLVVAVTGNERLFQFHAVEQLHGHARILSGDEVGAGKRLAHARREVVEIPDGGRHHEQTGHISAPLRRR